MIAARVLHAMALLVLGVVLAAVFALYQNPLFQIYLVDWGLC